MYKMFVKMSLRTKTKHYAMHVGKCLNEYKNAWNICRTTKLHQTTKFTHETGVLQHKLLIYYLTAFTSNVYHVIFYGHME